VIKVTYSMMDVLNNGFKVTIQESVMNINVGKLDRILRIILGLALIIWGVFTANLLGAIGIVLFVTGLLKRCPAYTVAGVSTK